MKDLYELKVSDVIGQIADDVVENLGIKKTLAKKLVVNALVYNCVQEEIISQVKFLAEIYDDDYDY